MLFVLLCSHTRGEEKEKVKNLYTYTDEISFGHRIDVEISDELSAKHSHGHYEIIFVLSGKGRYIVEGAEYELRARTLALIPPLSYHCLDLEEGAPYERYVIHFNRSAVSGEVKGLFPSSDSDELCFYSPDAVSDAMISVFERFEWASTLPKPEREAYMRLLLSELVLFLSVAKADKVSPDEGELGAKVIRYLNENISADISLDKLAKRFFVSKYYLCRAFKRHNGISIHGYVTQKRVLYAKQLIEEGETASGAAYRVGFGDYSAFYRAYMKIVGVSPASGQPRKEKS